LNKYIRINKAITAKEVRVIDEAGENIGVISTEKALALAEDKELDLIEISSTAKPPVAKLMDFGKYQYLEKRKAKQAKANSQITETKSIQIKIGTGEHDLEMKAKKIGQFIKDGHRVKVELFLPGRAKYLEKQFLTERLERVLKLIPEEYKVAEEVKKGPKGMFMIVEKK
jgi:translation initiation factor IF-3